VAAGDRYVTIGGGADLARQCLAAGVVNEIRQHVVPCSGSTSVTVGGLAIGPTGLAAVCARGLASFARAVP